MSVPARPPDDQLAYIIDKLAKFVARNGPEFEQMTKNKQIGNAQFQQFLFPHSEFFHYYQSKVLEERRNLSGEKKNEAEIDDVCYRILTFSAMPQQNFQPQTQQNIWSNNGSAPSPSINFTAQIETVNAQQLKLREQIMQSEKNLQAQHQVISGHFAQFSTMNRFNSIFGSSKICISLHHKTRRLKNSLIVNPPPLIIVENSHKMFRCLSQNPQKRSCCNNKRVK
jgi:hypothetical protein